MASFTIDRISDWAGRLRGLLYEQFKGLVSWNLWVDRVLAPQFQDLEDSAQTLAPVLDVDSQEGVQLDAIGRLVGQARTVLSDPTYRLYLRARIAANQSTGGPEEIYAVFRALYGATIGLEIRPSPIRSIALRVRGAITAAMAAAGRGFLFDSKEAATRAILEWQELSDDLVFTYATAIPLRNQANVLATSIVVVDPIADRGFPSSGALVIDGGLSNEETVTYLSYSGSTFVLGGDGIQVQHLVHAAVELVGDVGAGYGVGYYADAREATTS